MPNVSLSKRDIDLIGRVVETEVPGFIRSRDPQMYQDMVGAIVDTITNRTATGRYGQTVEDVLNQNRAFSKITGPSYLDPYGSVAAAPKASAATQAAVNQALADRIRGVPSDIPGALDYANPYFSDAKNLRGWVGPMIEAGAVPFGLGKAVHYHGLAPRNTPAPTDYSFSVPDDFMQPVDVLDRVKGIPTPSPRVSPEALGYIEAAQAMTGAGVLGLDDRRGPMSAPSGVIERRQLDDAMPSRRAGTPTKAGYAQAAASTDLAGVLGFDGRQATESFAAPVDRNIQRSALAPAASRTSSLSPAEQARAAAHRQAAAGLIAAAPIGSRIGIGAISPVASPAAMASINPASITSFGSLTAPSVASITPAALSMLPTRPSSVTAPVAPTTITPTTITPTVVAPVRPAPVHVAPVARVPAPAPRANVTSPVARASTPSYSATDVWSGRAPAGAIGIASNGAQVSRDRFGNTSITNQFGATTTFDASGRMVGTVDSPVGKAIGNAASEYGPGILGGVLGSAVAGPLGGLLGSMVANKATGKKTGGLLGSLFGGGSRGGSSSGTKGGSSIGRGSGRSPSADRSHAGN